MAGLQVCDLRDAGIQAALQLPPRAPPCDERTGELRLQDATPVHMLCVLVMFGALSYFLERRRHLMMDATIIIFIQKIVPHSGRLGMAVLKNTA